MDNLTRSELKLILSGLHREREALRHEILQDLPVNRNIMEVEEYSTLVRLQDRIISQLDKMTY